MRANTLSARAMLVWAVAAAVAMLSLASATASISSANSSSSDSAAKPMNVLFLIVDDLRPDLGPYAMDFMHTPNIDRFAQSALTFQHFYVQYSFCAPSRNSFMTGRRPDRTQAWNFIDHFREPSVGANWTSLPEYFKNAGYLTLGAGKLYHPGLPPNFDTPKSWTVFHPYVATAGCEGKSKLYECPANVQSCPKKGVVRSGLHWCTVDTKQLDAPLQDMVTTNATLQHLELAVSKHPDKPFFIGLGIHKPHMPFLYPDEFLQLYDNQTIAPPAHPTNTVNAPLVSWHDGQFDNTYEQPTPTAEAVASRKAYYGAVAYTDSLLGTVLDKLEALGLANNTVVSLMGDHGWSLGENNLWRKMTLFENGVRVPFLIRDPSRPKSHGQRTAALGEAVDLYRTLAELAGVGAPVEASVQGASLAPVLDDPTSAGPNQYAFSQFAKRNESTKDGPRPWDVCTTCKRDEIQYMGYSIRSATFRYTEWKVWDNSTFLPKWDETVAAELYPHTGDNGTTSAVFDDFEDANVVDDPEYKSVIATLAAALKAQFMGDHE